MNIFLMVDIFKAMRPIFYIILACAFIAFFNGLVESSSFPERQSASNVNNVVLLNINMSSLPVEFNKSVPDRFNDGIPFFPSISPDVKIVSHKKTNEESEKAEDWSVFFNEFKNGIYEIRHELFNMLCWGIF